MLKDKKSKVILIVILTAVIISLLIVICIIIFNNPKPEENNETKVKIGDTIVLGIYEQDNNEANGPEPVEWQIIDIQNDKALIISRSVLDCKAFNEKEDNISWVDSSLRTWLNSDFYETAFSSDDKGRIVNTKVTNNGTYEGYDSSGCSLITNTKSDLNTVIAESPDQIRTQDNVFLLSIDEVNRYFASNEDRKAFLSDYGTETFIKLGIEQAKSYGSVDEKTIRTYYESSAEKYGRGFCNWWLRSPGLLDGGVSAVDYNGIAGQSMTASAEDGGVRPAMWIVIQ